MSGSYSPVSIKNPTENSIGLAKNIYDSLAEIVTQAVAAIKTATVDIDYNSLDDLPPIPSFDDVTVSLSKAIDMIETLRSSFDLEAPNFTFSYTSEEYDSALLDAIKERLFAEVGNDDYGLDPDTEEALFQRERDRENILTNDGVDRAIRLHAAGGFAIPTGAAVSAVQKREREALEKVVSASREIMIKRGDLYLEGRKLTRQQIVDIEKVSIELHMTKLQRELEAAKAQLQGTIEAYTGEVKAFEALAGAYGKAFDAEASSVMSYAKMFEAKVSAIVAGITSEVDKFYKVNSLKIEEAKLNTQYESAIAASALGAMNVNASVSETSSYSQSESASSQSSESFNHEEHAGDLRKSDNTNTTNYNYTDKSSTDHRVQTIHNISSQE